MDRIKTAQIKFAVFLALAGLTSMCSVKPKKGLSVATPAANCEGLTLGQTKTETCSGGERIYVCETSGLEEQVNTCAAEECVSFAEVKTEVFDEYCISCHRLLGEYDTAKEWATKAVKRVNLSSEDRLRMPQAPNDPLDEDEIGLLTAWSESGAQNVCDGEKGRPKSIDIDYIRANILRDLDENVSDQEEENTRYLIASHKLNEGAEAEELASYLGAGVKTLNSVNVRSAQLEKLVPVDAAKTIWRFDQRDFGLDGSKWRVIENADKLRIIDQSDTGILIRQITQTNTPWLHVDNLIDITQRNASVYYALTEVPLNINQFFQQIGVDFNGDLANLDAVFAGGNKSPISLLKNRLISRFESDQGYMWISFDPIDIDGVAERNLFQFPLLAGTGTQVAFDFAASEIIYTLPNQTQGYVLFDANGTRQDAAPLNIVADNRSPITPEIKNSISCHRCHSEGILPMEDQIRRSVLQSGLADAEDVERVKELYLPQAELNRIYQEDIETFSQAMNRLNVATAEDPINVVSDKFLGDWDVERTAAFLLLKPNELKECINQSAGGRAQVGQLLTEGTITYNQFVEVLPILIDDCQLFE